MNLITQANSFDFSARLPTTLIKIHQEFESAQASDIGVETSAALDHISAHISAGDTVAVGVGSRGITNLIKIVQAAVSYLHNKGAKPFIIPAMGSHAGATAGGQRDLLLNLGITPDQVGAEIRATMDVQPIGQIPNGPVLYQDVLSAAADHTILINRIKPHTSFRSQLESGLAKMAVIGLGKQRGAALMHSRGVAYLKNYLSPAARIYETNTNLRGGVAILENAYHQTAKIVGLTAAEIGGAREIDLLQQAKKLMPSLPFPEIDVLVVRQLGKNISGTGMDTNVIGRVKIPREPENFGGPDIAVIAVLDLTPETQGNANGLGLANVTTTRVASQIDWLATYTNTISAGVGGMWRASLPLTMPNDFQALSVAVRGCGQPQDEARWVFIQDTLNLETIWVSSSLFETFESHPGLNVVGDEPLEFDSQGLMKSPWPLDNGLFDPRQEGYNTQ